MNKTTKVLKMIAAILAIVAIAVAIVGTAMMYMDKVEEYGHEWIMIGRVWVYQPYLISQNACPESGILPTVGTVFAIVAAVFFFLSIKKRKATVIALCSTVLSQAALFSSIVLLNWDHAEIAKMGWYFCLGSGAAIGVTFLLSIIILIKDYKVHSEPSKPRQMSVGQKVLLIFSLIIFIIALGLSVAGTVIMFNDHTGGGSMGRVAYRTTGIMPLVGAVLLVVTCLFLILSRKKEKFVIGTWPTTFVAQGVLSASFLLIHNIESWFGYWLCVSASSVALIGFILSLIYGILSLRGNKASVVAASVKDDYKTAFSHATELLKEAKALLDSGIYTEEEFKMQKEIVFKRYGLFAEGENPENKTEDK